MQGKGTMDFGKSFCSETYKIKFCDVCKKDLKMKVVQDNARDDFIWCKCPGCNGIAPYSRTKEKAKSHKKTADNKEQEK